MDSSEGDKGANSTRKKHSAVAHGVVRVVKVD